MSAAQELLKPTDGQLSVRPLQPQIGAEASGVDLRRSLSDALRDEIKAAVLKYKVIFFRDQDLTADQHDAFARRFGVPYGHVNPNRDNTFPHITRESAEQAAAYFGKHGRHAGDDGFQTNTSWRLVPTWGAILRAIDVPEVGGDTIWANCGAAYEHLPDELKKRLEGLHVTHDFRERLNREGLDYPIVAHPIVKTHRETGQKILWVNFKQKPHIVGLDVAESNALLAQILEEYRRPEIQVRFSWRPNSIAFWDNRATVHYAVCDYGDYPRLLERILIADETQYMDL